MKQASLEATLTDLFTSGPQSGASTPIDRQLDAIGEFLLTAPHTSVQQVIEHLLLHVDHLDHLDREIRDKHPPRVAQVGPIIGGAMFWVSGVARSGRLLPGNEGMETILREAEIFLPLTFVGVRAKIVAGMQAT